MPSRYQIGDIRIGAQRQDNQKPGPAMLNFAIRALRSEENNAFTRILAYAHDHTSIFAAARVTVRIMYDAFPCQLQLVHGAAT
jgi:hypothetical protein